MLYVAPSTDVNLHAVHISIPTSSSYSLDTVFEMIEANAVRRTNSRATWKTCSRTPKGLSKGLPCKFALSEYQLIR